MRLDEERRTLVAAVRGGPYPAGLGAGPGPAGGLGAGAPAGWPDAASLVENEVRELVRRRALDPAREPVVVRRLVDDVLGDYEERVLTSDLPPIVDRELVARLVYDAVAGFGPLQRHLDDPAVEEIWINEPGRVFIARHGRSELTTTILTGDQVQDLVERMLKTSGRRVDLSTPFVDAMLPDGSRLHVVIPDVTRLHWSVNIRKFILSASSLDELVAKGTLPPSAAAFLEASVIAGLNIIIAGGTQAGKTTMLNCLGSAIPARERVISCEEVFELRLRAPDWVAMQTRQANLEGTGEIRLRRLIKEALRMRPDRLLVGEVRQEEALDLLIALNSGLPGMCSLHANSAREAVTKLCTLPLLAGENVSHNFVVPTVAASVDLVVHLIKDAHGRRRVTEIVALPGRAEGDVVEVAQIFRSYGDTLVRAEGYPPHPDRFARAGYDLAALLAPPDRGWPEIAVER
ncbi:CpaF family protein [Pseudofrankia inefficax]|uniref:Type II secretion system protein E n=1 Tax=Pseudofrankia inefficax (strain DSM 45817 / CECT 9037 / DDB 130130 / EuI1c) TaxID=298654 RepID=E3J0V0_PSEI1|nr:type II secretion system protein E [Pseudofrankia inefficax]